MGLLQIISLISSQEAWRLLEVTLVNIFLAYALERLPNYEDNEHLNSWKDWS